MLWPVGVLVGLSGVGGLVQIPGAWSAVNGWLAPAAPSPAEPAGWAIALTSAAAVGVSLLGVGVAWRLYGRPSRLPERLRQRIPRATGALEEKLYVDRAYDRAFYEPVSRLALVCTRLLEPTILGVSDALARSAGLLSARVSALQSGLVRSYVLAFAAALVVLALIFIVAH